MDEDFFKEFTDEDPGDYFVPLEEASVKYYNMLEEFMEAGNMVFMLMDILKYTVSEVKYLSNIHAGMETMEDRQELLGDNVLGSLVSVYNLVVEDLENKSPVFNNFYGYKSAYSSEFDQFVQHHYEKGSNDGVEDFITGHIFYLVDEHKEPRDDTKVIDVEEFEMPGFEEEDNDYDLEDDIDDFLDL